MKRFTIPLVIIAASCGPVLMAAPGDLGTPNSDRAVATSIGNLLITQLLGPIPYRSFADSPFATVSLGTFHLEDFEDGLLNVPGVSISRGSVTSAEFCNERNIFDSVDGDDGNPTDGVCNPCDSYFGGDGSAGLIITFSTDLPLPTHAGIVWTDGKGLTRFEAFDQNGASLGVVGPIAIADDITDTSMAEDRFFGAVHEAGISRIRISNTSGGIEVDHLQFGHPLGCGDHDGDGFGILVTTECPEGDAVDCDDDSKEIFPGAGETLDGIDNNCDLVVDEGFDDDGDGVPDFWDECNDTPPGTGVTPDGCALPPCTDDDDDGDHDDEGQRHGGRRRTHRPVK